MAFAPGAGLRARRSTPIPDQLTCEQLPARARPDRRRPLALRAPARQQPHRLARRPPLVGVFLACTAAYALSRFRFPGRAPACSRFLVTQMFPGTLMLIPLYVILDKLGLLDNAARPGPRLRDHRDPVLRVDAQGLLRHHPAGARGGGAHRRRLAAAHLLRASSCRWPGRPSRSPRCSRS